MQTPSQPELHNIPERVRVFQFNGAFAFWASREEAHRYLQGKAAVAMGWPRKIVGIRFAPSPNAAPPRNDCSGKRLTLSHFVGQRYSDTRESNTNPPRVWRLKPIESVDRAVFITSITDCLTSK